MDSRILSASIASLELEVEPYLDSDYTNTYPTSATYYGVVFTYNYSTGLGVDSSNSIIVKEKEFQGGKVFRNYVGSGVNDSGIVYGDGWTKPSDAIHRKNLDLLTSNFRASQKHEDYQNFTAFSIDYTNRIALFYGNVGGRKDFVAPIRFKSTYLKVEPVEIKDVIVTDVPRYDRTIELTSDSYSKVEDMLTRLNGGDWWKNVYTLSHKINEEFGEYTGHVTSKYPVSDYYSIKLIVSDGMKPKFDDSYSLNITDGVLDREINRSDLIYRVNYNFMDDKWKVSGTFAEDKNESDTVYTIGDNLPSYIVVPIVNHTGKVIKELQVKLNVSLHQSQYEDIVVEIPSSLDLFDEDINKEAVVSAFEQYFNSKYNNIMSRITNGDTVPLSVGYDGLSNYVSVKLDNGFKDSDTGNRVKNYRFVEEPVATVYVDARSLDDNFFVVKDAVRDKLAEYLSDNGKDIDDYNIESISRDYVYNGNRTVVDTLDGIVKRDENIIVAVLTDKDSGKRKTIRFIAKPIANLAYFIETTEPIDTARELTEEEYKHIEDEYGVTYPRESAIYSYTVSEDGKSADVLLKNGVLYKNGTVKDGLLKVTLKPYTDTSRVVVWRKSLCSCGGKLVTIYPLYRIIEFPKDEPDGEESEEEPKVSDSNMPKVSDSNIPKVSDSNIPKKHEPKRDKPSPKENVEPKVPNDRDYPRENDPKDPTVITYIPQGNGGTEELFKKDGSVNGTSREKEQEEERIRQEMLDNELKAKNMKANTRGAAKTADTRHMILMFAMFMGSAVLFAKTILAKKKYEDNMG